MSTATAEKPALDNAIIIPFIASARDVMRTMLGLETTIERPRVRAAPAAQFDYSGIISFSGDIVGLVIASFPKDAAIKLVEKFAGCPIEPDTADFSDALGELTNMIAGAAKKDIGRAASISVPTVVMGKGHVVASPSDTVCLTVPCVTPLGNFSLDICVKQV